MRILRYLKLVKQFLSILWRFSGEITDKHSYHWHLVGFTDKKQYDIIFDELHRAHLNYDKRLKMLRIARISAIKRKMRKAEKKK